MAKTVRIPIKLEWVQAQELLYNREIGKCIRKQIFSLAQNHGMEVSQCHRSKNGLCGAFGWQGF
jgi:hypothetical protein